MNNSENKCNNCECNEKTITVAGYFGGKDKQINKEDFANIWWRYIKEANSISWTSEWMSKVEAFANEAKAQSEIEFDRIYDEQNK